MATTIRNQTLVEKELIKLLDEHDPKPVKPQEAYKILAERFRLTEAELSRRVASEEELKWHNEVRQATRSLVYKKIMLHEKQAGRGNWLLAYDPSRVKTKEASSRSGPPPRPAGKWVYHDNQKKDGWVYILRWGETDIYKYGYTNNYSRRIDEISHHIPNEENEFPNHATWLCMQLSEKLPIEKAYALEQSIKREVEHLGYNTAFERFRCTPRQLKNLVKSFL